MTDELERFLGEAGIKVLQTDGEAKLHPVVFDADNYERRIAPFLVGPGVALSAGDRAQIVAALTDESTWDWAQVSRHRAMPQHLIVLQGDDEEVVMAFDDRGQKLGFIRNGRVDALDFRNSATGIQALRAIVQTASSGPEESS